MPSPEESQRLQASLQRLYDIYVDIARTADRVSRRRCPYKDAGGRCTAGFGCRNQRRSVPAGDLPNCAGSDKLDYRSAWEV